jgi:capsule polysaccharide export protein KpsE/RkpR
MTSPKSLAQKKWKNKNPNFNNTVIFVVVVLVVLYFELRASQLPGSAS